MQVRTTMRYHLTSQNGHDKEKKKKKNGKFLRRQTYMTQKNH